MIGLFKSSAFRLALAAVAAGILATVMIVTQLIVRANRLVADETRATLALEADDLERQFTAGGTQALARIIAERDRPAGLRRYRLSDQTGAILAGSLAPHVMPAPGTGLFSDVEPSQAAATRLAVGIARALPGGIALIVARDIDDQRRFTSDAQWLALLAAGVLAGLGLGGGALIARDTARRVGVATRDAEAIMAGDLSRRLTVTGSGDEFDSLAAGLNGMLARIEELMAALREVSDNIAHDLKTPLNRLRNRAEAALREETGAPGLRTGLERVIEEADSLIQTFNALLLIARLEGGAVSETLEPLDVAAVVGDVVELYEPAAEVAGLDLVVSAEPGAFVRANRQLLGQAIANLIDNAIKYAPPAANGGARGRIAVAVGGVGATIEITVADRGPGIAPADRERALKRFVRLERSRSKPGTGLGLSLVSAVARLHGGSVRLEDNVPGLRVVLALPGARAGATKAALAPPTRSRDPP